jgi:hypothetical protein
MQVDLILSIKAKLTLDGGYNRLDALPDIERTVQDKVRTMTVLVKQGALEPKPVQAVITLESIQLSELDT